MKCRCPYCKQECQPDGAWQECLSCRVCFVEEYGGLHIKWEREIGDWSIALNLYPQADKTVLVAFRQDFISSDDLDYDKGQTTIRLNRMMRNVNQHNCLDKIKLLLMFQ